MNSFFEKMLSIFSISILIKDSAGFTVSEITANPPDTKFLFLMMYGEGVPWKLIEKSIENSSKSS